MLALCIVTPLGHGYAGVPKEPTFIIHGPTVLAFFPPVTQKELETDGDSNEALSDFQHYATQVRRRLSKLGIDFKEMYARSFRITSANRTTRVRPAMDVGYYFIAPGKKPRIQYGVETDADLIQLATEYFGVHAK